VARISFKTKKGKHSLEQINLGDRKGCSISPVLFNLYLDDALRSLKSQPIIRNFLDQFGKEIVYNLRVIFGDCRLVMANDKIPCRWSFTGCTK
jgi:hypothetical protein